MVRIKAFTDKSMLKEAKMVDDEDTAYDEVIRDLNSLNHQFVEDDRARKLITEKLKQLIRLLGDDDGELE